MNLENLISCLSKRETKTRKCFKYYLIAEFAILSTIAIICCWNNTLAQLWGILLYALSSYMFYHCTYKKHGTAWLTYCMIGFPFIIINNFWNFLFDASSTPGDTATYFFSMILIYGAFYFFAFKMRRINRKIQIFKFVSSENFQQNVAVLRSAKTEGELTSKFYEIFQECPSRFCGTLSLIYNEIKENLVNARGEKKS